METNTARDLEQVVRMFVEMDVGPVSPSSTTQDTREILHSAKDLGVGIASRIPIHPCKTILYPILEVFTHSSRKSINHCVYINKLFSFVITEVSPNNNTDN